GLGRRGRRTRGGGRRIGSATVVVATAGGSEQQRERSRAREQRTPPGFLNSQFRPSCACTPCTSSPATLIVLHETLYWPAWIATLVLESVARNGRNEEEPAEAGPSLGSWLCRSGLPLAGGHTPGYNEAGHD